MSVISTCFSQALPVIILKGIITNASTGEAISYATVRASKNGLNTMSNENGLFIFKMTGGSNNDSVYISHVGYKPVAVAIHPSDTGFRVIQLHKDINLLTEVVVKGVNAPELVKSAIARIPGNYAGFPYVINGFYRVTGKKEKRIVDLSEAVFAMRAENYSGKNRQYKVIRARLDKDLTAFGGMEGLYFGLKPEGITASDIISAANESGLLSEEGLKEHIFTYKGTVDYNGQEAYKIAFEQKDGVKKSLDDGLLYLDVHSLAFLQFTTWKSPKGIKYGGFDFKQRMMLKLAGIQADLLQDSSYITYRKYGGKYYPDHIYGIARWHITGGRRHFELNPLHFKYNFLITEIDTTNTEMFKKEEVQRNSRLIEKEAPDKNTDSTDAFWGNYNLIQAEFNVDSASRIIRANNETLHYKNMLADKLSKYSKDKAVRIDSILSFYYQKGQFNGTALVKYDGRVIYEKGFGLANREKNIPNSGQTQFRIGSTSKQFTAMLILQLANENRLSVSDTAGKFIPGYPNGRVTIGQLLTHQSGLPDYLQNEEYVSKILTQKYALDELVKQFCSDTLAFEPGAQIDYSNTGYIILACIIEKVTGKKYADVLNERIFIPLGMAHSYFAKKEGDTALLATGYINNEPELAYPVENETGAGGITSTAADLLLWHDALSANTLLPKDKMAELFKPRVEWDEWGAYYGYGWMIDRLQFGVSKKHTVQYHPGTEAGFFDMLVRQPDKDIFIILLNNKGDFPRFDMTDLILNELN